MIIFDIINSTVIAVGLCLLISICYTACDPLPALEEKPDSGAGDDIDAGDPGAWFEGTWGGLMAVGMVTTNAPRVGQVWSALRVWSLVTMVSDGQGTVTVTMKGCMSRFKTSIPGSSIQSTQPGEDLQQTARDFDVQVYSSTPESPFASDTVYIVYGMNPCDEAGPELPDRAESTDSSVPCDQPCTDSHCDQDMDGHPGVTFTTELNGIVICDAYVSGRDWWKLNGEVVDQDTIAGAVTNVGTKRVVHGASDPLCDTTAIIAEEDGCPEHQYFRWLRLADDATCDDVIALTDCGDNPQTCDTDDSRPLNPLPASSDGCDGE